MARLGRVDASFRAIPLNPSARPWIGIVQELDIEAALVARLRQRRDARVTPQVLCHGLRPDILVEQDDLRLATIVELKRWLIDARAVRQITAYVEHWASHLPNDWTVQGILAAPGIRPDVVLPPWCGFQELAVAVDEPMLEPPPDEYPEYVIEPPPERIPPRGPSRPTLVADVLSELMLERGSDG